MAGSENRSTAPSEEAKERFRQALEAKKAQAHRSADGGGEGGSVRGSETAGATRRQFRRKSGSS